MIRADVVDCVVVSFAGQQAPRDVPGMGPLPAPSDEYLALWNSFTEFLKSTGIRPLWFPAEQYGAASYCGAFSRADALRVVEWLKQNGVVVTTLTPAGGA